MSEVLSMPVRTFIGASEVWIPQDGRLVHGGGDYGSHNQFASISERVSFAKGEGLPGKAWAEARPVVLKEFDNSYFARTEAAKAAGLTSAVAIPVFDKTDLKAVLVVLCSDSENRIGAVEVWEESDGVLSLNDGYYGAAKEFEFVSKHTQFPRGQGLPGGVWASSTPILMRDLGSGYRFVRAESAGKAGLTTGLGMPITVPGPKTYVLTLLSALETPIARRFEIWDGRSVKAGGGEAVLIDGICERDGPLWSEEQERRISAWEGPVGKALGSGLPVVERGGPGTAGFDTVVAMPIHGSGEVAYVVAWYF